MPRDVTGRTVGGVGGLPGGVPFAGRPLIQFLNEPPGITHDSGESVRFSALERFGSLAGINRPASHELEGLRGHGD